MGESDERLPPNHDGSGEYLLVDAPKGAARAPSVLLLLLLGAGNQGEIGEADEGVFKEGE